MSMGPASHSPAAVGPSVPAAHASQHGLRSSEPYLYDASQSRCLSVWACAVWACAACDGRKRGCGVARASMGVSIRPAVRGPAVGSSVRLLPSHSMAAVGGHMYIMFLSDCHVLPVSLACMIEACGGGGGTAGMSLRPAGHCAVGSSIRGS